MHPPHAEAVAKYAEVAALLSPHVDLILCETVASLPHARAIMDGALNAGLPIWLSVTVDDRDGTKLRSGEPVAGCSVAWHLTKLGRADVVLLGRKQLTSGTTWHAAGLIGQLRATANMTRLAKYSQELYGTLAAETGVSTGFRRVGSITAALTAERLEELTRFAAMARAFGVEVEEILAAEIGVSYSHLNLNGVKGGVYLAKDGQGDPTGIALALAKGARMRGAVVAERVCVTRVTRAGSRVTGVDWESGGEQGHIACDMIVNCAGMRGREVGLMAEVNVPLQACEHFYIVSEPIAGLGPLPVLRVPDECACYKQDAGRMMLGAFEPVSKPWGGCAASLKPLYDSKGARMRG